MAATREIKGCSDARQVAGCADARQVGPCSQCWVPQWVDVTLVGFPSLICCSDGVNSVGLVRPSVGPWRVNIVDPLIASYGVFGPVQNIWRDYSNPTCTGGFTARATIFYVEYVQSAEMARVSLVWWNQTGGGFDTAGAAVNVGPPRAGSELLPVRAVGSDLVSRRYGWLTGASILVEFGPPHPPIDPVGPCFRRSDCVGVPLYTRLARTISGLSLEAGWSVISGGLNGVDVFYRDPGLNGSLATAVPLAIVASPGGTRAMVQVFTDRFVNSSIAPWETQIECRGNGIWAKRCFNTSNCLLPAAATLVACNDQLPTAPLLGGGVMLEAA